MAQNSKNSKGSKGSKDSKNGRNKDSLQIYARVRGLMPWEPKQVSLSVVGDTVQNKSGKIINSYNFRKVFKPSSSNEECFKLIAIPMISNVLKGFNAILIAYGQTGSGKTYSMLGKPKLNIVGLLPRMLSYMIKSNIVSKVELSAVEAFGHHVAKIYLFDLFDKDNQIKDWSKKKGLTTLDMNKLNNVEIKDEYDAHQKIIYAHSASHFAPTGKNPESSRGHVAFIAKIYQDRGDNMINVSYFIMVDCAGSEGETAFTEEFKSRVTPQTLLCRRLEAGTINTGLCQLQVIFNELRTKGRITKTVGNGLRRVLHPYINTKTYLSVLFTLSPSINNSKATESTLKFAVTAGMVKVKPIKMIGKVNFKTLVAELKRHIEQQEARIDTNNDQIGAIRRQKDRTQLAISKSSGKIKKIRIIKKEFVNEDGEIEIMEEKEIYYVNDENVGNVGNVGDEKYNPSKISDDTQNAVMDSIDLASKELMDELGINFKKIMESQQLQSNKSGISELSNIISFEENENELKIAIEQYKKLTAEWQKKAFIIQTKKKFEAKLKDKQNENNRKLKEDNLKSASQGLIMIDQKLEESENDFKRLKERQKEILIKLNDPLFIFKKDELTEHAMELQILLAEQESITKNLKQSRQIIIEYLKDDGREALIKFFEIRIKNFNK